MRSRKPLTNFQILFLKNELKRIKADSSAFVFKVTKDENRTTWYDQEEDVIHVCPDVLPDIDLTPEGPFDTLSPAAFLARMYYGYRTKRVIYSHQQATDELWKEECLMDINVAKICPGLNEKERANLIEIAIYIADQAGFLIETDAFTRKILYGEESGKLYSQEKLGDTISFVKKNSNEDAEAPVFCLEHG